MPPTTVDPMTSDLLPDPDAPLSSTATRFREWLARHADELEPFRHEVA